jgi:hypothetical protein
MPYQSCINVFFKYAVLRADIGLKMRNIGFTVTKNIGKILSCEAQKILGVLGLRVY